VALAWDGQSAQADFVSSLRRIHSLGWRAALVLQLNPRLPLLAVPCNL